MIIFNHKYSQLTFTLTCYTIALIIFLTFTEPVTCYCEALPDPSLNTTSSSTPPSPVPANATPLITNNIPANATPYSGYSDNPPVPHNSVILGSNPAPGPSLPRNLGTAIGNVIANGRADPNFPRLPSLGESDSDLVPSAPKLPSIIPPVVQSNGYWPLAKVSPHHVYEDHFIALETYDSYHNLFLKNIKLLYRMEVAHGPDLKTGEKPLWLSEYPRPGLNRSSQFTMHVKPSTILNGSIAKTAGFSLFNEAQRGNIHPDLPNHINPNAHGRNIRSPLDQFEIKVLWIMLAPVIGFSKICFTNMGLYLTIYVYINAAITRMIIFYKKIRSYNWYAILESIYTTVHSIVTSQINDKTGQIYFPFMYNIFTFILINNLIGLIPYAFSSTSHFILAFLISFSVVLGCTLIGMLLHKSIFFSLFVPSGCPKGLLPLLVLIELISYLARNVSLGLRLAANILSGHMLLHILSGFTFDIFKGKSALSITAIIPLLFIGAFTVLEIGISFIQSQVFTVLSSSYLKDALFLH